MKQHYQQTNYQVLTMIIAAATISTVMPLSTATAQQQTTEEPEYYTNEEAGFRFQLPAGWVAEEKPSDEPSDDVLRALGQMQRPIVTICPELSAQPMIDGDDGGYDCVEDQALGSGRYTIGVSQYDFDLLGGGDDVLFRELVNMGGAFTTDTLWDFELQQVRGAPVGDPFANTNIRGISETDRTTDIVDADSGEVIAADVVQVKEAQYTYRSYVAEANNLPVPDEIRTRMIVVYNNPEGVEDPEDIRAYMVWVGIRSSEGETVQDSPPGEALQREPVRTVFDSFELLE